MMMVWSFIVAVALSGQTKAVPKFVWLAKPDGSLQCQDDSGEPIGAAVKGLIAAGVKIGRAEKRNDGQIHMTVCGSPTGQLNAVEVYSKDRKKAEKLGYRASPPF